MITTATLPEASVTRLQAADAAIEEAKMRAMEVLVILCEAVAPPNAVLVGFDPANGTLTFDVADEQGNPEGDDAEY